MKMIKYIAAFFIITVLAFQIVIAQEAEKVNVYGTLYHHPQRLEGTPYLKKDWSNGTITNFDGKVASPVQLKFNLLSNDLIYYNESIKQLFKVDKETLLSFTMNIEPHEIYFFEKYTGKTIGYKLKPDDFIHVLYKGRFYFFVKHSAEISESNEVSSNDKVFPKNSYFIQFDGETNEIKLKLKSVLKLFPEQKKEIKKLANQLNFRKKSEHKLVELLKAIESI